MISELEVRLVYRMSSRTVRATQGRKPRLRTKQTTLYFLETHVHQASLVLHIAEDNLLELIFCLYHAWPCAVLTVF